MTDLPNPTLNHATSAIGYGAALAMSISYHTNEHIGWALVHGVLSWLYVIYCLAGYGR